MAARRCNLNTMMAEAELQALTSLDDVEAQENQGAPRTEAAALPEECAEEEEEEKAAVAAGKAGARNDVEMAQWHSKGNLETHPAAATAAAATAAAATAAQVSPQAP